MVGARVETSVYSIRYMYLLVHKTSVQKQDCMLKQNREWRNSTYEFFTEIDIIESIPKLKLSRDNENSKNNIDNLKYCNTHPEILYRAK